jgi:hypothetical protein
VLLGADTGFFLSYANDHPRALEIWQELVDGLHALIVSTLTLVPLPSAFYRTHPRLSSPIFTAERNVAGLAMLVR